MLELLVAMVLMVVAASCLYTALYTGFRAYRSALSAVEPTSRAINAIELLKQDIHGILPPDVTARETDVLLLVLAGFTTPEIAARLGVSQATARSHCRSLLRKCGAPDRRQLRAHFLGGCSRLPHVWPSDPASPRARRTPYR